MKSARVLLQFALLTVPALSVAQVLEIDRTMRGSVVKITRPNPERYRTMDTVFVVGSSVLARDVIVLVNRSDISSKLMLSREQTLALSDLGRRLVPKIARTARSIDEEYPHTSPEAIEQHRQVMVETMEVLNRRFLGELKEILTPEQYKKFGQLYLQSHGNNVLRLTQVLHALAVGEDQIKQLEQLFTEQEKVKLAWKETPPAAKNAAAFDSYQAAIRRIDADVLGVLTNFQRNKLKGMLGEPD